jgi:acyl-CoA thioester hydrolase
MHSRFEGEAFVVDLKVRDSECDAQGVVNNANYLVYMECARHEFLEAKGIRFGDLVDQKIFLMTSHMEIDFINSLIGQDRFEVRSHVSRKGPKAVFDHEIKRLKDGALCLKARVDIICKHNGRLTRGDYFDRFLTLAETSGT